MRNLEWKYFIGWGPNKKIQKNEEMEISFVKLGL